MFLFKKSILSTLFEERQLLFAEIRLPAAENSRSDGTEVAGMQQYTLASLLRQGYRDWPVFLHHCSGSVSILISSAKYCFISSSIRCSCVKDWLGLID